MAYDFPNAPTIGQVANGYTWDGEKWVTNFSTPNPGGVIAIKVFTTSGTYTPSPNMSSCVIECVGGGGGGGSSISNAADFWGGGGGGGGAYARKFATAADIGASQNITVGAGAPGAYGGVVGAKGGTSSIGTLCSAEGGYGAGYGQASVVSGTGGTGGSSGVGDCVTAGGSGDVGAVWQAGSAHPAGFGGASFFAATTPGSYSGDGIAGRNGSGGGGSQDLMGSTWRTGGSGGNGLVVITEYGLTALTGNSVTTAVRYDVAQTLTTPQQTQARTNINAPSFTDINAAVNPIPKNYIINGGMTVSQENGNVAGGANGYYPVDQFTVVMGGTTGIFSAQQVASVTAGNSPNRIRVTCTTADAAVAAGDYVTILQTVEGFRMADLRYGTAGALQTTLRFGVKAPAGTYGVVIQNGDPAVNRSYVATFTITAGQTNTDTVQTLVIPGDVTGAWNKDNKLGMYIQWCLMGGTTYQTTAGWKAGNFITTSAQYNLLGATGRIFELFDVGLYIGATAPPFQVPDYAAELASCQRYYQKIAASARGALPTGGALLESSIYHTAIMRSVPTVAIVATGSRNNVTAVTAVALDATMTRYSIQVSANNVDVYAIGDIVALSARL